MASTPLQYKVRSALTELTLARIRELTREPEAVFWVFVFPILLAAILSLAFRSRPPDPLPVGVVNGPQAAARMAALSGDSGLRPRLLASEEAAQALAQGHVVLTVDSEGTPHYTYDPTQPDSRTAFLLVDAALQRASGRTDAFIAKRIEITKPGARYVDFLVPGLLGMNLMGTGMWGIGFSLVVARNGNLLKRLIAAPARRSHVLGAQLISRLLFLVPEAGTLLVFAHFALGVPLTTQRSWPPSCHRAASCPARTSMFSGHILSPISWNTSRIKRECRSWLMRFGSRALRNPLFVGLPWRHGLVN